MSSRLFSTSLRLSGLLLPLLLAACSSGDSETGGDSGAGGSTAGAGGSTGGSAGSTGGSAGKASGGSAGKASGGTSGQSGAGGKIACEVTNDCVGFLPDTKPASCAKAVCDEQKFCRFVAKDLDSDGDPSNSCASQIAGITIELGGDCDDGDDTVNSKAWDGPKGKYQGEEQPDRCDDGADNDCNGKVDDGQLDDGTTCKCTPGDVRKCSADSAGKPINFPGGAPVGLCAYGNQTCSDKGKWSECIGAIGPAEEECNGKDDDCDGETDEDDAKNKSTWLYDNDGDAHAPVGWVAVKQCTKPGVCPAEWPDCTDPTKWLQDLPADDCNDHSADIRPGIAETCDGIDNNCVNGVDEGCVGQCKAGEQKNCGSALQLKGKCAAGVTSCLPTGAWGPCSVQPAPTEACNPDSIDENCNGQVNEGCTCLAGDKASCSAALGSKGSCASGIVLCQPNGTWGTCSVASQPETCKDQYTDEDCDGTVNEGCLCIEGNTTSCTPPVGCQSASGICSNGMTGAVNNCKGYNCPVTYQEQGEWTTGSNGSNNSPPLSCAAGYHRVSCEVLMKDSNQGWQSNIKEWWGRCDAVTTGNSCYAHAEAGWSYYANCRIRLGCQGG